ncbi:MAG TPA: class I SAM-dependent methyltransferase [Candidatus Magasanikbacteria bacterium]|nr:class I SAM-dependent methyltransferase [Candidatus Magasanikbacteria bacterium]
MSDITLAITKPSKDYELLDSGDGEKLERYGNVVFRRPDPQALWAKSLNIQEWNKAQASFNRDGKKGDWNLKGNIPERWQIEFGNLKLWIRPTSFKHTGLFPEQLPNWDWMREKISAVHRPVNVLNLFGYTGGASIAAAQAGASVVHVDGSKVAIQWGKDNAKASGLEEKPIRWLLDDARVFVKREIKRGNKYDGILLDPPAFGHGPKKELWKIEEHLPELLKLCTEILSDKPVFFLVNGYASGYSSIAYENNLKQLLQKFGGSFEKGELAIEESKSGKLLPCGIFSRWSSV